MVTIISVSRKASRLKCSLKRCLGTERARDAHPDFPTTGRWVMVALSIRMYRLPRPRRVDADQHLGRYHAEVAGKDVMPITFAYNGNAAIIFACFPG